MKSNTELVSSSMHHYHHVLQSVEWQGIQPKVIVHKNSFMLYNSWFGKQNKGNCAQKEVSAGDKNLVAFRLLK